MIISEIKGGLGNQLFQFAVGYAQSKRLGVPLGLDVSHYDHDDFRSLDLKQILQMDNISYVRSTSPKSLWFRLKRKFNRGNKNISVCGVSYTKFIEPSYSYSNDVVSVADQTYLCGYWQSPLYFNAVEGNIRKVIHLPKCKIENKASVSCSIHIRRGDYVLHSDIYTLLDMDYYTKAMDIIRKQYPECYFYVFSDTPDQAKKLFNKYDDCSIVCGESALDDLSMMSQCDHHIIGNSTFSWWGAWLNPSNTKTVIAPKNWFTPKAQQSNDIKDLYPKEWMAI